MSVRFGMKSEGKIMRPAVLNMAKQMEIVLTINDNKRGWKDCSINYLVERLHDEVKELDGAFDIYLEDATAARKLKREAIDVANFAMMIVDNLKDTIGT